MSDSTRPRRVLRRPVRLAAPPAAATSPLPVEALSESDDDSPYRVGPSVVTVAAPDAPDVPHAAAPRIVSRDAQGPSRPRRRGVHDRGPRDSRPQIAAPTGGARAATGPTPGILVAPAEPQMPWAGRPFSAATAHLPFASARAPRLIGLFTDLLDDATPVATSSDLKAVGQANVGRLMELPAVVGLTYDLEERIPALRLLVCRDTYERETSGCAYPSQVAAVLDEGDRQRVLRAVVLIAPTVGAPVVSTAGLLG